MKRKSSDPKRLALLGRRENVRAVRFVRGR
jgi:hypothetical protein